MRVKRFVASNMQEAMRQIKNEMGQEAVILHTRHFKEGGVLGFFSKDYIEITAAAENNRQHRVNAFDEIKAAPLTRTVAAPLPNNNPSIGKSLHARLLSQELDEKHIQRIVKATLRQLSTDGGKGTEQLNNAVYANLLKPLKKGSPISFNATRAKKPKIYAFIGPTGVGKTTTIAKLAAHFAVTEQKKVALVTIDTYRIAAAEQLKTIAEILDVPVHVVYSYNQLSDCLLKLAASDIVFIDTAGRSHKNSRQLEELKNYLALAAPDDTFLVLSAAGKYRDLLEIIDVYGDLGVSRLIFTKLDETSYYGALYNIACACSYPLAYFTNGQNIPEDIEAADPVKIVQMLMKEQQKL